MANSNEVAVVVRVRDVASRGLKRMLGAFRRFGGGALRHLNRLKKGLFSLRTLMAGALLGGSIKFFTEFESGMAQVSTLVDTNVVNMEQLGSGIKDLSTATGEGVGTLTKGLFDAISAGVAAEDAIGFLGDASRLAIGGGTDTATAIKGVVSLLNAYGMEADRAGEVSDALFQSMKGGITTVGLLSSNVGKVAPVARQAGVSMDEMLAALSALTKGGLSTEEAGTALRSTLTSLIAPTDASREAAAALNIEWDAQALKSRGLLGTLQQLNARGVRPTVEQQAALSGSVRGFVGVASLAADEGKNFNEILDSMADKSGATDEAFNKVNDTLERKALQAWQSLKVAVIEVVGVFADDLKAAADGVRDFVKNNTPLIKAFAEVVRESFALIGTVIGEVFASNGKSTRAFTEFFAVVFPRFMQDILLTLVDVMVLVGSTLGAAFSVTIGNKVKEGLNEITRLILRWGTLGLGAAAEEIFGFSFDDFELFDVRSNQEIVDDLYGTYADTFKRIADRGKESFELVDKELQKLKTNSNSKKVAKQVDALREAMENLRREMGLFEAAQNKMPDNTTPLTGPGGPLEGMTISKPFMVGEGAGGAAGGSGGGLGMLGGGINKMFDMVRQGVDIAIRSTFESRINALAEAFPQEAAAQRIQASLEKEIAALDAAHKQGLLSTEQFNMGRVLLTEEANRAIDKLYTEQGEKFILSNEEIAGTISQSMTQAFTSIIDGTKSVGQAFGDMVTSILSSLGQLLIQRALFQLIGGLLPGGAGGGISINALGNAFRGGKVTAFAQGGVVGGPTMFPMRGGAGLMGEAGPEAIMPLSRGPGGRLGVQASGGGPQKVVVEFNVVATDSKSFDDQMVQRAETIKGIIREAIARDGTVRASIKGVR